MNNKLLLILCFAVAIAIILYLQRRTIQKWNSGFPLFISLLLKLLAVIVVAYLVIVEPNWLWHVHFPLSGIYIALFADFCGQLFFSIISAIQRALNKQGFSFKSLTLISFICGVLFLIYGMINMSIVTPEYHTYISSKIDRQYKFVFIADVHNAKPQSFGILEKVVEEINGEAPDFVVLGGDITDDFSTAEEMRKTYGILGRLSSEVYFVYGNHDRQGNSQYANGPQYSEEELIKTIEENGITILRDEFVEFGDDMVFLGREDSNSTDDFKPAEELIFEDQEKYSIVFVHNPYEEDYIKTINPDLQVAAHSHAGQFWPLQTVYNLAGFDAYGEYAKDSSILYVSSGLAGWRIPFRSEAHCHYDVFMITPDR